MSITTETVTIAFKRRISEQVSPDTGAPFSTIDQEPIIHFLLNRFPYSYVDGSTTFTVETEAAEPKFFVEDLTRRKMDLKLDVANNEAAVVDWGKCVYGPNAVLSHELISRFNMVHDRISVWRLEIDRDEDGSQFFTVVQVTEKR